MIIGELAIGGLSNRHKQLNLMANMVVDTLATHDEVLRLVDTETIHGIGIGWIDAHLIATTLINRNLVLWTRDRRIRALNHKPTFGDRIPDWR